MKRSGIDTFVSYSLPANLATVHVAFPQFEATVIEILHQYVIPETSQFKQTNELGLFAAKTNIRQTGNHLYIRQTGRQTDKQRDRQTHRQADIHTHRDRQIRRERQTDS